MTIVNVKCSNLSLLIFLMLVKKKPLLSFYDYRYYIINNIRFYCFLNLQKKAECPICRKSIKADKKK